MVAPSAASEAAEKGKAGTVRPIPAMSYSEFLGSGCKPNHRFLKIIMDSERSLFQTSGRWKISHRP